MHGRLKVRTTQEQEERKRLEREKKLKGYKHAMSECLSRIDRKEYDQVGFKISEEILSSNGDIQTLWNYRKNFIESNEIKLADNQQELVNLFLNELTLTEICLKKNPKSYSSWYQRQWCLLKSNQAGLADLSVKLSWKNELRLCDLFLQADERNFHCWTHRFFVVKNGNLSKLDELQFTYEKICSNFSNYSSWHYRSKLIEDLYYQDKIDSEIFKNELNLIENAIFTDPNDQSAWIYEKWFLLEHQRGFYKQIMFDLNKLCFKFKFAKEINLKNDLIFLKLNNFNLNENLKLELELEYLNDDEKNCQWTCQLINLNENEILKNVLDEMKNKRFEKIKIELLLRNRGLSNEILLDLIDVNDNHLNHEYEFKSKFQMKDLNLDSELVLKHLNNILELNQLEQEKSKWCLLTSIELMCIIDYNKYKQDIFNYLDKLANEIDLYRREFYISFKEKIRLNNQDNY